MAATGAFVTLHHARPLALLCILLLLPAATAQPQTTLNITNRCSYTVWPAVMPVGDGVRLDPGETWTLNPAYDREKWRVWPRTGCSFNSKGNGSCQTGDCDGVLACKSYGQPPFTSADFTLHQYGGTGFFDISLYFGFNVPMEFLPVPVKGSGGAGCSKGPRCAANITSQCPSELKAPGGCNSACIQFLEQPNSPYCCVGNTCESNKYSAFFSRMCPDALSYSSDAPLLTEFSCPEGVNYQLEVATKQFKDKLGEGGFGSVFEGLLGEERIAVKRLARAGQGKREFLAEVQTIGSIHHINLVRLFGFCAEKSHMLLVYEYMPKGSLDKWIYGRHDNTAPPLEWKVRCKIITNIAKGLAYLHELCMKRIAHLDVKPQNILIDDDFNAKISDFGLCKLIDRDMSQVVTRMRGTPGYLAPEWLTSQITEKADVYSFGVVVMEMVSGRKNLDTSRSEESIHLITLLEEKVKNGQLVDLIDKNSNDMQAHQLDVIQMMKLAMWCLQIDSKRRPKMSEVVKVLEGTMDAESNIDHNFVATNHANFGIAANVTSSAPPLASHLSGPR
ncbi:G-type lectin S-receptor-like serine/threonine-protein kinase SD2-5 [Triticum urartu]|uniref:G-type lectin S-receptor-like serine/threonine-protein kinase SD2-5 n=1 Tax=Triticum urartu TaxID=4572 RepID=UPI0020445874|nr:G-type lectin S-receptor-like serine/threonine-protein kinase SD2-5 [Triticum urartu]